MTKTRTLAAALLWCACALGVIKEAQVQEVRVKEKDPVWAFKFQDYAVTQVFEGKPAPPILMSKSQRMYRMAITVAARKGPNFAGHYTIAEWGCGSGCTSLAVVDAVSGHVYDAPFGYISMPMPAGENGHNYQGSVYQLKSRLLIADGCLERKEMRGILLRVDRAPV